MSDCLKAYTFHKTSEKSQDSIDLIRVKFSELHQAIDFLAPGSREKSIALTNLETASMWAVKAIVHGDPESKPIDPSALRSL